MKKNYTLSLETKTLTITKAFEEAVTTGKGAEYTLYKRLMKDIPDLKIVRRTHKTPSKYTSKSSGETFDRNQYKNLTYEMMERVLPLIGSQEQNNTFATLRKVYENKSNGYKEIRNWFLGEFPDFRKNALSYLTKPVAEKKTAENAVEEKVA